MSTRYALILFHLLNIIKLVLGKEGECEQNTCQPLKQQRNGASPHWRETFSVMRAHHRAQRAVKPGLSGNAGEACRCQN